MTIQEAYKRFLLKIAKNDTDDTVRISPAEFVFAFNEHSLKWLSNKLKQKNNTSDIDDLYDLLVEDSELTVFNETKKHNDFVLPEDFFHFVSATALAEKDGCERDLYIHNIKPKEKNSWLQDDLNNPSFEWEETISIISNNHIQVYKSDFDILSINFSYYKRPNIVDIEGYTHIDHTPSKTIHPELQDESVNEIINRIALAVDLDYKNPEAASLDTQRILTE